MHNVSVRASTVKKLINAVVVFRNSNVVLAMLCMWKVKIVYQ